MQFDVEKKFVFFMPFTPREMCFSMIGGDFQLLLLEILFSDDILSKLLGVMIRDGILVFHL